jgi:hypothetical protein
VNTPSLTPHFPTSRTQPSNTPNYPLAPTFNATNQPPTCTAYQVSNQPAHKHRTPAEHMNDVIRLALPIHPNTPAGQVVYNAQIAQWNTLYAGQQVNETRPYPSPLEPHLLCWESVGSVVCLDTLATAAKAPVKSPDLKDAGEPPPQNSNATAHQQWGTSTTSTSLTLGPPKKNTTTTSSRSSL